MPCMSSWDACITKEVRAPKLHLDTLDYQNIHLPIVYKDMH